MEFEKIIPEAKFYIPWNDRHLSWNLKSQTETNPRDVAAATHRCLLSPQMVVITPCRSSWPSRNDSFPDRISIPRIDPQEVEQIIWPLCSISGAVITSVIKPSLYRIANIRQASKIDFYKIQIWSKMEILGKIEILPKNGNCSEILAYNWNISQNWNFDKNRNLEKNQFFWQWIENLTNNQNFYFFQYF